MRRSHNHLIFIKMRWLWDSLIFIMGIPILVSWCLYFESGSLDIAEYAQKSVAAPQLQRESIDQRIIGWLDTFLAEGSCQKRPKISHTKTHKISPNPAGADALLALPPGHQYHQVLEKKLEKITVKFREKHLYGLGMRRDDVLVKPPLSWVSTRVS